MRYLCSVLLFSSVISGGQVSFGIRGGIPVSKAFEYSSNRPDLSASLIPTFASYASKSNPYTMGPSLEFHVPFGFSAEVDALYRHMTYHYTLAGRIGSSGYLSEERKVRANRWEFPILLKYRLPTPVIRPYLDAGISINHVRVSSDSLNGFRGLFDTQFGFVRSSFDNAPELNAHTTTGAVIGGGVEFGIGPVKVSPELRYTRWKEENFVSTDGPTFLRSNLNQVSIIVGLMFRSR